MLPRAAGVARLQLRRPANPPTARSEMPASLRGVPSYAAFRACLGRWTIAGSWIQVRGSPTKLDGGSDPTELITRLPERGWCYYLRWSIRLLGSAELAMLDPARSLSAAEELEPDLASALLARLRDCSGDGRISYAEAPTRLSGGYSADLYQLRLESAPREQIGRAHV